MDIITMHWLISHDCEGAEEKFIQFYTFSLCGHIGHTDGPETQTHG